MPALFKTALFVLVMASLSLMVFPVRAQLNQVDTGQIQGLAKDSSIKDASMRIINWFLGFLGMVAVVVVMYGGAKYIFSGGNESAAEGGKKVIVYAVIGLILVGLAAVIVNTVLVIFIAGQK